MIGFSQAMRHFHRLGSSASLGIFGTALVTICGLRLLRSALTRKREAKAARAVNKEACDSFICRHGLPDCRSIVFAIDGVARQGARNQYWDPDPQIYIVVSLATTAPGENVAHHFIAR